MSKLIKDLLASQLKKEIAAHDSAVVVDVTGLTGREGTKLRGELAKKKMRIRVVKNSAAKRALNESKLRPLADSLTGANAMVFGGDSVVAVAKELLRISAEMPKLGMRNGIVEGDPSLLTVEQISKLPTRQEIQGMLVSMILGPGGRLAGILKGGGGRVAGCIKAIEEKLEKGEAVTKA